MAVVTREEMLAFQERVIHALSGQDPVTEVDSARLEFVRDLARAKRIAKIKSVLPRTCRALDQDFVRLSDDFVHATPPTSFRSRADALAFYRFLRRAYAAPELLELAYCELALSAVRTSSSRVDTDSLWDASSSASAVRRAPGVRLRICKFDVRAFFEGDTTAMPATIPPSSPILLAILADPPAGIPRIAQLSAGLFDFLRALRTWQVLPDVKSEDRKQLLQLQQWGLLELVPAHE